MSLRPLSVYDMNTYRCDSELDVRFRLLPDKVRRAVAFARNPSMSRLCTKVLAYFSFTLWQRGKERNKVGVLG